MTFLLNQSFEKYQTALLHSYYKGKGKNLSLQPFFTVLLNKINSQKVVKILDIGCGVGSFLDFISTTFSEEIKTKKIELYGLDYDISLINKAKEKTKNVDYFCIDLSEKRWSDQISEKFDIVLSTNTFHEVYSYFLSKNDNLKLAEDKTEISINNIFSILNSKGTIIFYDGLLPSNWNELISFKLSDWLSEKMLSINNGAYSYSIDFTEDKGVLSGKVRDFCRLILLIKFIDTSLWQIERSQCYQYFDRDRFISLFDTPDSVLQTLVEVSNDLELWQQHIEIISKTSWFPRKSILLVANKK